MEIPGREQLSHPPHDRAELAPGLGITRELREPAHVEGAVVDAWSVSDLQERALGADFEPFRVTDPERVAPMSVRDEPGIATDLDGTDVLLG